MLIGLMMGIMQQFHVFHYIADHGFFVRECLKQEVAELMSSLLNTILANSVPMISWVYAVSVSRKKGSLSS
jgi:hypothetical protein